MKHVANWYAREWTGHLVLGFRRNCVFAGLYGVIGLWAFVGAVAAWDGGVGWAAVALGTFVFCAVNAASHIQAAQELWRAEQQESEES